jgi:hypothetical protein
LLKVFLAFLTTILNSGTPRQVYVKHKALHAIGGIGIAWVGHEMGYPKTGVALAFGVGIAKELYDQKHGGSFRAGDVAWTGMPAAAISIAFRW